MFDDPDTRYHSLRARQEMIAAISAGSIVAAAVHMELGVRHLRLLVGAMTRNRHGSLR